MLFPMWVLTAVSQTHVVVEGVPCLCNGLLNSPDQREQEHRADDPLSGFVGLCGGHPVTLGMTWAQWLSPHVIFPLHGVRALCDGFRASSADSCEVPLLSAGRLGSEL